jgi:hypothetical protein
MSAPSTIASTTCAPCARWNRSRKTGAMNKLDQAREEAFYVELSTELAGARQRAASERERLIRALGLQDGGALRLPHALPPLFNEGSWNHEFVLATQAANQKHAELMKKFPDMEHDDPNALRLSPFASGAILWKFTKRGAFEYACLIPGHREAGMHGEVIVK